MSDADGEEWLRGYLSGDRRPSVPVPADMRPVEFLLASLDDAPNRALPERVGTLAGGLLATAVLEDVVRGRDGTLLRDVFSLVESLPVSDQTVEFLHRLATMGSMLARGQASDTDFHLLTLRALVTHQRPWPGEIERLLDVWRRELADLRYAGVAMQGLARVSAPAAIAALPGFIARALGEHPPVPLADTIFAFSQELGESRALWEDVVRRLREVSGALEAVQDGFTRSGLHRSHPIAWEVLRSASTGAPSTPFATRYTASDDPGMIEASRRLDGVLLEPRAA